MWDLLRKAARPGCWSAPAARSAAGCGTRTAARRTCWTSADPVVLSSFPRSSRTEAPSRCRHCPVSPLLRTSPPPRPMAAFLLFPESRSPHRAFRGRLGVRSRCGLRGHLAANATLLRRSASVRVVASKTRYDFCQERGLPAGSDVVESACKQIIGRRFKRAGAAGRKRASTPCSPPNAASKTIAGPTSSIGGPVSAQPPDQRKWDAPRKKEELDNA